ncbi:MAG: hypothetical protein GY700_11205, partial [Propionibacteriaceae bacterium]|nr:hypothetical protein [Propionibacteriaceae bacterium]
MVESRRDESLHLAVQRFADWRQVMDKIEPTTLVLSTDCRDIVFQKDPFAMRLPADNYYPAWEGIMHKDDPWAVDTCRANFPDELGWIKDRRSYCAGTILGGWWIMRELFGMIFRVSVTGANHRTIPSDQCAFNLLTNQVTTGSKAIPVPWLSCTCGTWLVDKFRDKLGDPQPTIKDGVVGDFALVHQYERVPGLAQAIVDRYCRAPEQEPEKTGEYSGLP